MGRIANNFREMEVYQEAFAFQQDVFEVSKSWPKGEMYALTDQARRSTRSIGANFAEAWGKRRYPAHFLSKLTDSDGVPRIEVTTRPDAKQTGPNLESQHWIDTAEACGYITEEQATTWRETSERIGRLLGATMAKHQSFKVG